MTDAAWLGPSYPLTGTGRTVRASARFVTTAPVDVHWEVLWNPSYGGFQPSSPGTVAEVGPTVHVAADGYVGVTVTLPDQAAHIRVGYRISATDDTTVVRTSGLFATVSAENGLTRTRFVGSITDLSAQVEGAVLQTQVQCIGMLAKFGDRYIGDQPFPVETDAQRAERIAAIVGGAFLPNGSTQVTLRTRDVDRKKVADVLRDQAGSTGALLWEAPDGTVHYDASEVRALAEHAPPRLAGSEIIADAEWRQEMSRFIPRVIVEYGHDQGEGAERPVYVTGTGTETKINTELNDLDSATLVGDLIVRRWGNPAIWDAPRVHTSTQILTPGGYEALLATEPGDVIETELLADEPIVAGPVGRWFVEGWTETWDGDPLVHSISLSVSDYQRFTLAGEDPMMGLHAYPPEVGLPANTWVFNGPPVWVQAVLGNGAWPTLDEGTFNLYCEGREIQPPVQADNGEGNWRTMPASMIPVGEHVIEAHFSGVFAYWQPDVAYARVNVLPSAGANVAFTATPTSVRNGSTQTLAATVSNPAGKPAAGTVTWVYSQDGGGTWRNWLTDRLVGGTVRRAWKAHTPASNWQWKARYNPDAGQGMAVTESLAIPIDVLAQQTQTKTYTATWGAVYQGTGAVRAGLVNPLVQGRHSTGTYGDQRSLAGFSIPTTDWTGWSVTKVEVYLYFQKWAQGSGTARIGSHTYTAAPASSPKITTRQNVAKWGVGAKWVDVTAWGKPFATGAFKGLTLGPGNSTNTIYYGEAHGHTGTYKPKVRITGSRWV
jgi:hypothetical protein